MICAFLSDIVTLEVLYSYQNDHLIERVVP